MDTSKLLAPTAKLFEALEVFQMRTDLRPDKQHFGAHVKLVDFNFNRDHLVRRLKHAIIDWVFCKAESERIFNEEFGAEEDRSAAAVALYDAARETFRPNHPQGQFGELLLSGFLQHLFQAAPLLRKQVVRTSDNHERFGADAIHYSNSGGHNLYLGESKCYKSKYKFSDAFEASLESMNTTLTSYSSEIKKFATGNFIEDDLKLVASDILRNKIPDLKIHPTSIIIYNEHHRFSSSDSDQMKSEIREAIKARCANVADSVYEKIHERALSRLTYIILPVWELDKLLQEFEDAL